MMPNTDVPVRRTSQDQRDHSSSDLRTDTPPADVRFQREAKDHLAEATGTALRRAYLVAKTDRGRSSSRRLGFSQLDYGRLFQRDQWTMFAIARELGCTIEELLPPPDHAKAESRVAWSDLVQAAESILSHVAQLSPQVRDVAIFHAQGLGQRLIVSRLPGRLAWSVAEDLAEAIASLGVRCEPEVWLLARSDHRTFSQTPSSGDRHRRKSSS